MRALVITKAQQIRRIDESPAELQRLSATAWVESVLNLEPLSFDEDVATRYVGGASEQFRAEYIPALRRKYLRA